MSVVQMPSRSIAGDSARDAKRGRVEILGMGIDPLTYDEVADELGAYVRSGGSHQVVTVNLDFLAIGSRNPAFRALVNDADIVTADGMPVRWAARYLGGSLPARITGPDLIEMAVRHSGAHGSSVFFLGAAPGVAALAVDRLVATHGAFHVAGIYAPPMGPLDGAEDGHIRRLISDARPDFLFVAFGCPKQDFWIQEHRDLGVPVAAGIGGSFDYLSGRTRRAPRWAQSRGLEWVFRLSGEPRRLAKRYLIDDVQVLGRIGVSRLTQSRRSAPRP